MVVGVERPVGLDGQLERRAAAKVTYVNRSGAVVARPEERDLNAVASLSAASAAHRVRQLRRAYTGYVVTRACLAVFAAVALIAANGCGGSNKGGSAAAESVARSAESTKALDRFHFTLDVQNVPSTAAGLQLTAAEGDVIVPDRARADVTGNFSGTPITTQIIAIGDRVWLKNPLSGAWQQVDVSTTPIALLDPSKGVLAVMQGISDPTDEGTENVDGVTLRKFAGTVAATDVAPLVAVAPSSLDVPVTLWIDEKTDLLHRIEIRGPVADGEPQGAVRVVEVSRFDEPVTITAPKGTG